MTIRTPDWKTFVLGALLTVATTTGGIAYSALERRTSLTENKTAILEQGVTQRTERVAVVETKQTELENRFKEINEKLDRLIRMHLVNPATPADARSGGQHD